MTDPSRSVAASRRLPASDHGTAYRRPEPTFNPLAWRREWFRYMEANRAAHGRYVATQAVQAGPGYDEEWRQDWARRRKRAMR